MKKITVLVLGLFVLAGCTGRIRETDKEYAEVKRLAHFDPRDRVLAVENSDIIKHVTKEKLLSILETSNDVNVKAIAAGILVRDHNDKSEVIIQYYLDRFEDKVSCSWFHDSVGLLHGKPHGYGHRHGMGWLIGKYEKDEVKYCHPATGLSCPGHILWTDIGLPAVKGLTNIMYNSNNIYIRYEAYSIVKELTGKDPLTFDEKIKLTCIVKPEKWAYVNRRHSKWDRRLGKWKRKR